MLGKEALGTAPQELRLSFGRLTCVFLLREFCRGNWL